MTVIFTYFDSLYCNFLVRCRFYGKRENKNVIVVIFNYLFLDSSTLVQSECMKDNGKSAL